MPVTRTMFRLVFINLLLIMCITCFRYLLPYCTIQSIHHMFFILLCLFYLLNPPCPPQKMGTAVEVSKSPHLLCTPIFAGPGFKRWTIQIDIHRKPTERVFWAAKVGLFWVPKKGRKWIFNLNISQGMEKGETTSYIFACKPLYIFKC